MILQQNREALERQDALKRKLLAICDSESVYAKNLMECFSQSEDMGYRVRVFSDAGQLFQYGKQHTIDLLLMGDQYPEEMRSVYETMRTRMGELLKERIGLSEATVEELDGMTSARIAKLLRERGQAE